MRTKKTTQLVVRMESDAHESFAAACRASDRKQSDVIRELCGAAVAYARENEGRLPRMIEIRDRAAGTHIPTVWLGRVLLKVRNLAEIKDIVASVLVAGFPLGWNSAIGPGAYRLTSRARLVRVP